jgi:superfamily II DNA or RNA helicase
VSGVNQVRQHLKSNEEAFIQVSIVTIVTVGQASLKRSDEMSDLYSWQRGALDSLKTNNYKGIINASTGVGKTRTALEAFKVLRCKTLIIVPTVALLDQWLKELRNIGVKEDDLGAYYGVVKNMNKVTVAVINSVFDMKDLDKEYSLLILDEVHRYGADSFQRLLLNNSFKYIIGLTATLNRGDGNHELLLQKVGSVVFTYTTNDAVNDGLLNQFTIVITPIGLPVKEKEYLTRLDGEISKLMESFDKDLTRVIQGIKHGNRQAGRTLKLINERKMFYNRSRPKVEEAVKVIEEAYKNKDKIIVFGEYIDIADYIHTELKNRGIDSWSYYSGNEGSKFKLNAKDKKEVISSFKAADKGILITVKALDEGLDVKDANVGIVLGYNKTARQAVQRMGRILRKAEGKHPKMYLFYYKGTSDYFNVKNFVDNFKETANLQWR